MTDLTVRVLTESASDVDELRTSSAVFRGALHRPAPSDEDWPLAATSYEPGRTLGAFQAGELIGTASSIRSRLALPGGSAVPMTAVSRVGVRADRTRRGALTGLMSEQFRQAAANGEVAASLRASEATIYGRFGYGVATRAREVTVRGGASLRPAAEVDGEIRLLDPHGVVDELTALYRRIGRYRPGMVDRPEVWWTATWRMRTDYQPVVAVHDGPDGPDGYVVYRPKHKYGEFVPTLVVDDLHAADPAVRLALWRFVCGVDLVTEVTGWLRPLDEPLEWLFADRRTVRTTGVEDETWLRLLDVLAALSARTYGDADPVVVEVADRVLPANAGRYRITAESVTRTDEPADLAMDVAALGSLYLGDVRPSTLATVGAITVRRAAAVDHADRLFGTSDVPWCGTFF